MLRESAVEKRCNLILRSYGWEPVKVGHTGFLDRIILKEKYFIWVEYKTPHGQLTPAQKRRIKKCIERRQLTIVISDAAALKVMLACNHYPFNSF